MTLYYPELCGNRYSPDLVIVCTRPDGHEGPHHDQLFHYEWDDNGFLISTTDRNVCTKETP